MKKLLLFLFLVTVLSACGKGGSGKYTAVKPRYHRSWPQSHVHKKKWHIGKTRLHFEKQGTKTVKMK
jgi:hypothetical protein